MAQQQQQPTAKDALDAIEEEMVGRQGFRFQALMQYILARGAVAVETAQEFYVDLLGHDRVSALSAAEAFKEDVENIKKVLQLTADLELEEVTQESKPFLAVRRVEPAESDAYATAARESIGKKRTEKTIGIFIYLMNYLKSGPGERVAQSTVKQTIKARVAKDFSPAEIDEELARLVEGKWLAIPEDEPTEYMLGVRGEAERRILPRDSDGDDDDDDDDDDGHQ